MQISNLHNFHLVFQLFKLFDFIETHRYYLILTMEEKHAVHTIVNWIINAVILFNVSHNVFFLIVAAACNFSFSLIARVCCSVLCAYFLLRTTSRSISVPHNLATFHGAYSSARVSRFIVTRSRI